MVVENQKIIFLKYVKPFVIMLFPATTTYCN